METMEKHIGKRLKAARLKLGLKAAEVGAACNLTRSRIYGFEASKFILPKQLPGFAKALRIPPDGRDRGARDHDRNGRRRGSRASPCSRRWQARSSLGPNPGQDRLPRRQGGG